MVQLHITKKHPPNTLIRGKVTVLFLNTSTMPSLLTIPRELRDKICAYAILADINEPPKLTTSFDDLLSGRINLENPRLRAWGGNCTVKYHSDNVVPSVVPLLLVCHQLNAETISNLRIIPDTNSYDLDIILLDEIFLPTWLRVPVLTTRVDKVNVTFRIAGIYAGREKYDSYGFYVGSNGSGPAMSWNIYSILERFFRVGPTGKRQEEEEHKQVTIRTLDINVEIPDNADRSHFNAPQTGNNGRHRDNESAIEPVLDPTYLAQFIMTNIRWMIFMGDSAEGYGKIFHEHLDEVIVRKGGEEMARWDIAGVFKDLTAKDWYRHERETIEQWKARTAEKRRERGLRVLEEKNDN
jgi:hypothetical protein